MPAGLRWVPTSITMNGPISSHTILIAIITQLIGTHEMTAADAAASSHDTSSMTIIYSTICTTSISLFAVIWAQQYLQKKPNAICAAHSIHYALLLEMTAGASPLCVVSNQCIRMICWCTTGKLDYKRLLECAISRRRHDCSSMMPPLTS